MPRRKTPSPRLASLAPEFAPVLQQWLLKLLIPLGGHREFLLRHGFRDERLADGLGLGAWIDCDEYDFDTRRIRAELRRRHRAAARRPAGIPQDSSLAINVRRLAERVGLSEVDCRLLELAVLVHVERILDDACDLLGPLSAGRLVEVLAELIGRPAASVRESLGSQGVLARSGLLLLDRSGPGVLSSRLTVLSPQLPEHLCHCETDPIDLLRDILVPSPPAHLEERDFQHVAEFLQVVRPYLDHALRDRRPGVNILLHGAPGTGKTQLTRWLAAISNAPLYEVASADEDGDPVQGERRLRSFRAAQSFLASQPALVLFDEIEDILGTGFPFPGILSRTGPRKAWINRMLEENPVPAFWVSNSIDGLDPALLRRFDLIFEMPVPPRPQRIRILEQHCGELLPSTGLDRIAEADTLAPGLVSRSAAVIRTIRGELGQEQAAAALETLLNHTLAAQGQPAIPADSATRVREIYDPGFLRTDVDLDAVATGLRRAGEGRLCLHGPPGTGKTAWARWLARTLDRPLRVRRASDLLSKWLGESEQNLAQVFREAERERAVLLIDEVDSFLFARDSRQHSWEISRVNEMLTQMESFSGIFIASTNRLDGLDEAALRRFDLKVGFDFMTPEQVRALAARYLSHLGLDPKKTFRRIAWGRLEQVTPGDFAAILRQHRFHPLTGAQDLHRRLEDECRLKTAGRRPIGFQA